jgi:predicted chitinase
LGLFHFDQYDPVLASTAVLRQRAIDNENTLEGDGYKYRGRGCVHLTWKKNYRRASERFKFDYVVAPDLAGLFEHAVPIMFWGMRNGIFTGVGLRNYIKPGEIDYRNARRVINGTNEADLIGSYAKRFEDILIKTSVLSMEVSE